MPPTPPARAGAREWIALAVLGLPAILVMMNMSVLYLALPSLSADLRPSSSQMLWITDIYGFMVAGFLITVGTLGDRIGHRRILLLGATAFAAASVLAAYSTSTEMLITARALQGVAAATLAPSSLSIVRNLFHDPQQRTLAITIWMLSFMGGGALGPLVGGVLLQYFWWGSVFLVAVPTMVLLIATGPFLMPEFRPEKAGRLDAASVAMSVITPLAVVYGIKNLAAHGFDPISLVAIALGVATGVTFVRRQRRLAEPLLDLGLFRIPAFAVSAGGMIVVGIILFGTSLLTTQYLQLVLGFSPLKAGLWQLPTAVSGTVVALWVSGLTERFRPAVLMSAGAAFAILGPLLLTQADRNPVVLVGGSVLLFAGLTPFMSLGTSLVVGAAPKERAGAASAISETGAELGGALGIALLGSIATAVYGKYMTDNMPDEVRDAVAESARETLPTALDTAERLSDSLGAQLTEVARDAFTQSLHTHAIIVIPLLVALAVLTLRRSSPPPQPVAPDKDADRTTISD
ncbi:MFS transporter [Streptomyces sp. NPDC014894]|uniref:MFS transporter n=1 Tax=unclassified Streptomyces TaxID=2593676 RepID=UPI0037023F59